MTRHRIVRGAPLVLAALAMALTACSGDDDETPGGGTTPPNPGAGALPRMLLECFADRGYDIESPDEIHTAPEDVVEECFAALHQGGA